jgi:predicted PurR-regulated permease PerM
VLSVVRDGRSLRGTVASQFSPGLRPDAMALITIVHRALGTFLRVQLAAAAAVGVAVYAGTEVVDRAGIASYGAPIAIAAFMGTAQVIPQLGGLVGALPIVLVAIGRQDEPEAAIALIVVYLVALQLVKMAVGGRLGRDLNVRPAIALPAFAVISQIGLVWLLLSAPILVIAINAVRYLRGRMSDPPQPAGMLPGERRRRTADQSPAPRAALAPVPSVYRDRVATIAPQPAARRMPPEPAARPMPTQPAARPTLSQPQPIPGGRAT